MLYVSLSSLGKKVIWIGPHFNFARSQAGVLFSVDLVSTFVGGVDVICLF